MLPDDPEDWDAAPPGLIHSLLDLGQAGQAPSNAEGRVREQEVILWLGRQCGQGLEVAICMA